MFVIYSSARSKDLSEGTSSNIFWEREKKAYDPRTGSLWVTNHSLFSCEVTVRINQSWYDQAHLWSPDHPHHRVSSMLSWTPTTTARQPVVWGRLWGQLSACGSAQQQKCLVRPTGQAPRPASNHCLTAAVASPTCAYGKSPKKAKSTVGTWHDKSVCVPHHFDSTWCRQYS